MKKTKRVVSLIAFLVIVFPLVGIAKTEQKIDQREPKAEDVKIHKKQLISEEERKALEEAAAKVKPAAKDKVFQPLATGVLGQSLPEGGKRYAIVVGLANYTGTANDLCVAGAKTNLSDPTISDGLAYYCRDEDALNMKNALLSYGYPAENIVHLRDYQATRQGIVNAMNNLKSIVGPNDEIVFFFSGHGTSGKLVSLKDNETIDEAIFTYDNNYLWDDELKIWADSLNVNRMVFIFDSCLAGGMNDLAGTNRVLAMSSGETQSSYTFYLGGALVNGEYQESEGLFAHYFVKEGMVNSKADGFNLLSRTDNEVAVEESFSYTYPIVKIKQTPVLNDRFTNDLLLGY